MSTRARPMFLMLAVLALLVFAAACGGGGGGAAAQPTAAQPAGGAAQPTAASGGASSGGAAGDPAAGKTQFTSTGCTACHKIAGNPEAVGNVGPELTHVATDAEQIIKDTGYKGQAKNAQDYLRESIVSPNTYITPKCPTGPCQPNIMPQNYKDTLNDQQINNLVAYLTTLK